MRPGRTTILEVLENDTDPDGDVLTVAETSEVAESQGRLELIDGGRALQFTPQPSGAAGTVSFRYTVDDGRRGVAEASVNVRIVPEPGNVAPTSIAVGRGQRRAGPADHVQRARRLERPRRRRRVPRERLADERRLGAVHSRRLRHLRPHSSGELGLKEVAFTVSDGQLTAAGTLHRRREARRHAESDRHARLRAGLRRRDRRSSSRSTNDLTPVGRAARPARRRPGAHRGIRHPQPRAAARSPSRRTSPASYTSCTTSARIAAVSVGLVRVRGASNRPPRRRRRSR